MRYFNVCNISLPNYKEKKKIDVSQFDKAVTAIRNFLEDSSRNIIENNNKNNNNNNNNGGKKN